jgi:hypothetical protein
MMKVESSIPIVLVAVAALLLSAPAALEAYPTYRGANADCSECHGGFIGGQDSELHQLHFNATFNCVRCHIDFGGNTPVFTNMAGTVEEPNLGCTGCHGRIVDGAQRAEWAPGLRLYHANEGVPPDENGLLCSICHSTDPTPLPENVAPENYGQPDVFVTNSCNSDGTEDLDGNMVGLDNDGDLVKDGDDPDCAVVCDGVVVDGPSKVAVDEKFDLDVSCATPSTLVRIAGGRNADGSQRFVPGCGTVQFDIGPRPNNFGSLFADGNGDGTSSQTLGASFGGRTVYYQVIDSSTCVLSGVLAVEVNAPLGAR